MKVLFISNTGEAGPIAYRMKSEGTDVSIYIHNPSYKKNYNGMGVRKVGLIGLKKAIKNSDTIIFDINKSNDNTKEDRALLNTFKISLKSPSVFGPVADKIRKILKKKVIGCSGFCEEIEMDRNKGSKLAKKIGIETPETWEFDSLRDGTKFLKGRKDLWVFKPSDNKDLDLTYVEQFPGELYEKMSFEYKQRVSNKITYILQKVVNGMEISTEGWFDGSKFVSFNHTIEDKDLLNGGLGPKVGSMNNTVWIKKSNGLLVPEFRNLEPILKRSGYVGPIDANCIVSARDKKPYFLEWTPRAGYDAIYCLLTLVKGKISDFLLDGFKGKFYDGYASSCRISIPPYPYAEKNLLRDMAYDVSVGGMLNNFWMEDVYFNNGIRCAGSDGILGAVSMRGNSVGGSVGHVYREIKKLKIGSYLQYRTDLGVRAEKTIKTLNRWKINIY